MQLMQLEAFAPWVDLVEGLFRACGQLQHVKFLSRTRWVGLVGGHLGGMAAHVS
jgi:hypothetical protein